MEFYFRKDGQMLGPMMIFKVRSLVEEGKLSPDDMAWHEGMEEWLSAREVPALELVFGKISKPEDEADEPADAEEHHALQRPAIIPPPLPMSPGQSQAVLESVALIRQRTARAWQRFLARFIDITLFTVVFLSAGVQFGLLEPGELAMPRLLALLGAPLVWIFFEVICLRLWGATPGKALLGLQVVTEDDQPLTMRRAFSRTFDVWFVGCGMELPVLSSLLKIVSFFRYRQTGTTSWDTVLELKVVHRPVTSIGIVLATLLIVGSLIIRSYAFFHNAPPSHLSPEERSLLQQFMSPESNPMPEIPATKLGNDLVKF